ncbi:hypothetical protein C8F04DRAFT_1045551 [Mycena alexandri]|uniref:Uncharacterized protein n=1 Tax=Mycena alexandri TaxID=1745969 RepID=A0AAD6SF77_9AGAR|nr:hypothetical protein C8F04DRAFT_1045551 [Mycena alexandri]
MHDSFIDWLDKYKLRFLYTLPEDTKIIDLVATVVAAMQSSSVQWQFSDGSSSLARYLRPHETLDLQLLGLVNKGSRSKGGDIYMRRQPANRTQTLSDLLADRTLFAKPKFLVRDRRLIVKFGLADRRSPGGLPRRHSCLSTLMHDIFSIENEKGRTPDWSPPQCDSDGETDNDSDIEELHAFLVSKCSNTGANQPCFVGPANSLGTQSSSIVVAGQNSERQPTSIRNSDLWDGPWVPQPAKYGGLFDMADLLKSIFETASSGSRPRELVVEGTTMDELVDNLMKLILEAVRSGDFTLILSPDRSFQLLQPNGVVLSFGVGVEREAWYTAFRHFIKSEGAWFLPRFDNRCSIATTMSQSASGYVSQARLDQIGVLGCITSLLLIHGIAPEPFSPALIQFAANGCDLSSLSRDFLREWHPELVDVIDRWDTTGAGGDITSFQYFLASYLDIQAAALRLRNDAQHRAIKNEMVYHSLIGSQLPSHPEIATFFKSMQLGCPNGFDFFQVIGSFPGGSTTFLSHIWTSVIHDFDSLRSYLTIRTLPPDVLVDIAGPAAASLPIASLDLRSITEGFLSGQGIPCPDLFSEAKGQFSTLIPFENIDSPAFRSIVLCWAVTGSPHIEADDHQHIELSFVGPTDTGYHASPAKRSECMAMGKIAFRTCFRTARIPASYLVQLCSKTYPAKDEQGNDKEPFSVQQAIEHWLLVEFLGGIGHHTIA